MRTRRPVMLGGEHLVTLGAFACGISKVSRRHIIHFDAHADLREDYLGAELSMRPYSPLLGNLVGDGKHFHQFGIRCGERAEFEFALGKRPCVFQQFNFDGLMDVVLGLGKEEPVYFTAGFRCIRSFTFSVAPVHRKPVGVFFGADCARSRCPCAVKRRTLLALILMNSAPHYRCFEAEFLLL